MIIPVIVLVLMAAASGYYCGRWRQARLDGLNYATTNAAGQIMMLRRIQDGDIQTISNQIEELLKINLTTRKAFLKRMWWWEVCGASSYFLPPGLDLSNCEKLIEQHTTK